MTSRFRLSWGFGEQKKDSGSQNDQVGSLSCSGPQGHYKSCLKSYDMSGLFLKMGKSDEQKAAAYWDQEFSSHLKEKIKRECTTRPRE